MVDDLACEPQTHFRLSLLERSDDWKCVCGSQAIDDPTMMKFV